MPLTGHNPNTAASVYERIPKPPNNADQVELKRYYNVLIYAERWELGQDIYTGLALTDGLREWQDTIGRNLNNDVEFQTGATREDRRKSAKGLSVRGAEHGENLDKSKATKGSIPGLRTGGDQETLRAAVGRKRRGLAREGKRPNKPNDPG